MNTYWRREHIRNRNGNDETVRGHFVTRYEWDHFRSRLQFATQIVEMGLIKARQYLDPNARCPECGVHVYFFRHENGGCAWFDGVGHPWPIHPCMEKTETSCFPESIIVPKNKRMHHACRNHRMQMQINGGNGNSKKKHLPENMGSYGFNVSDLFLSLNECTCCSEETVVFKNSQGQFCAFQKFGPPWSEHIPFGDDPNALKKYRQLQKLSVRRHSSRTALEDLLNSTLGDLDKNPIYPKLINLKDMRNRKLSSKKWSIFILESFSKNEDKTKLHLTPQKSNGRKKDIDVLIETSKFTKGDLIFIGKKVHMLTFFSQKDMKPYFAYLSLRKRPKKRSKKPL